MGFADKTEIVPTPKAAPKTLSRNSISICMRSIISSSLNFLLAVSFPNTIFKILSKQEAQRIEHERKVIYQYSERYGSQIFVIKFEELILNTKNVMQDIAKFLDIEFW